MIIRKVLSLFASAAVAISAAAADSSVSYESRRPAVEDRLFVSEAVEMKLSEIAAQITDPKLRWMFENCFPNTLDTTVHYGKDENGEDDTFIFTGDIAAMWLRGSANLAIPGTCKRGRKPESNDQRADSQAVQMHRD